MAYRFGNSNVFRVLQSGANYGTAALINQLEGQYTSLDYVGYNYPRDASGTARLRSVDTWEQTPAPVVQTAITDLAPTSLRLNWNQPTMINYLGNTVTAPIETYYWELYSDAGLTTLVQSGSTTALTVLVSGLTASTQYWARIGHGTITQAPPVYSNTETATTTAPTNVYDGALAIGAGPQYAYDMRPIVALGDTNIANDGTATAVTLAKTGNFTKGPNNGLVSVDALSRLRATLASSIELGHSATGGEDWALIVALVSNNVNGNQQFSLYNSPNLNLSRVRIQATSVLNQLSSVYTVLSGTAIGTLGMGTVAGARCSMLLKTANTIRHYNLGSTTPVITYNMVSDQDLVVDLIRWFENATGTSFTGIEAIYNIFAHGSVVTDNEADWINLMLLPSL